VKSLTLSGRRVLVTRATHQAGKLSQGLRDLGAEPVEVPLLQIGPPHSFEPLDRALRQLDSYDWLILTSVNTVCALKERAVIHGLDLGAGQPRTIKVAAVGEATAAAARDVGFAITFVPVSYVAESLLQGIAARASGKKILLARAAMTRDVIPEALRALGATIDVVEAYRNELPEAAPEQLKQALAEGLDAATFTSSSSVTHLADAARQANLQWPLPAVPAVSIGPVTSQTLNDLGWEPAIEATPSDIPGLLSAVERLLRP